LIEIGLLIFISWNEAFSDKIIKNLAGINVPVIIMARVKEQGWNHLQSL